MFRLITPSNSIINQYNKFWDVDNDSYDDDMWYVPIFEGGKCIDIRHYISADEFKTYSQGDKYIRCLLQRGDIGKFLACVNSVYHTRLNVNRLEGLSREWFEQNSLHDFIAKCKKDLGKNAYSFATKVYSFILPEEYPIVDRYVVTLYGNICHQGTRKIITIVTGVIISFLRRHMKNLEKIIK